MPRSTAKSLIKYLVSKLSVPSRIRSTPPSKSSTLEGVRSATTGSTWTPALIPAILRAAATSFGQSLQPHRIRRTAIAAGSLAELDVVTVDNPQESNAKPAPGLRLEKAAQCPQPATATRASNRCCWPCSPRAANRIIREYRSRSPGVIEVASFSPMVPTRALYCRRCVKVVDCGVGLRLGLWISTPMLRRHSLFDPTERGVNEYEGKPIATVQFDPAMRSRFCLRSIDGHASLADRPAAAGVRICAIPSSAPYQAGEYAGHRRGRHPSPGPA